jgi:hypothetical protein
MTPILACESCSIEGDEKLKTSPKQNRNVENKKGKKTKISKEKNEENAH